MNDKVNQTARASSHPLNQAAAALLPTGYQNPRELPVLALMRWGLENALDVNPFPANWPDGETLTAVIGRMSTWEPRSVMRFLTNPEHLPGQEYYLAPQALSTIHDPADAAMILLDALINGLTTTGD